MGLMEAVLETDNYRGVWVFAEQTNGKLLDVGLELLGEGRKLATKRGSELVALLLGSSVEHLADELLAHGADRVYVAVHPALEQYRGEAYAVVLERLARERKPEILLLGATTVGADLAPRVAAKLRTGLSADCVALGIDDHGLLKQVVPAFGGGVMATIICPERRPQMATVRPGVMGKPDRTAHQGCIEVVPIELRETDVRTRVVEVVAGEPKAASLSSADVVVGGGWGAGDAEGWKLVEQLAAVLGGAVGATRPALDEGWATEEQMIGQSGITVRPKLYVAVGISGVMHHMVGCQHAKVIVAINHDPKAPIFQACDLGIVGNYRQVVPHLIKELRRL